MSELWRDERAFIVTAELTLIATILVVGVFAGLASVRDQGLQELDDLAAAIENLNQSYSFSSVTRSTAWTAGSVFVERRDYCDRPVEDLNASSGEACVNVYAPPTIHEGVVRPGNPEA